MNKNYTYAINPESKTPVFQINKHIGFDDEDGQGIDGEAFSREVFEIDNKKPERIDFYTNSTGGSVKGGFEIFNSIISASSPTRSIIQGFAYSTSGWCPLAADKVEAYDYSTWMCHMPYDPTNETKVSKFINLVANSIATIISEKSGRNGKPKKSVSDIMEMMTNKVYYTANEMYEFGLIDEVLSSNGKVKNIDVQGDIKNQYKEHQNIVNKFLQNNYKEKPVMENVTKIANRLKLSEGTDEAGVIAEIANRENAYNSVKAQKEELENKVKLLNESQEENQKKMLSVQNELTQKELEVKNNEDAMNKLKADKEALELINKELADKVTSAEAKTKEEADKAKKDKAESLINKFVEVGRLKNTTDEEKEVVNKWIAKATENYEDAELMLGALPVNMSVPKLVPSESVKKDPSKMTLLEKHMAANKVKNEERLAVRDAEISASKI